MPESPVVFMGVVRPEPGNLEGFSRTLDDW
jgi:hypothetical protein